MSNPRKPTHLHVIANTARSGRMKAREGEPEPVGVDLREAPIPNALTEPQGVIWRELCGMLHPAVAYQADTLALEMIVRMIEAMRAGDVRPALMAQLRAALSSFGMTPADRSRVTASSKAEKASGFAALRSSDTP